MTTPAWVLLAFAAWTLATLFVGVGVYRWGRILAGRASTLVRIDLRQTETVAAIRFGLFATQFACMVAMAVVVAIRATA